MKIWLFVLPWQLSYIGGVNEVVLNLHRQMQLTPNYQPLVGLFADPGKSPVGAIHIRIRRLLSLCRFAVINPHFPTLDSLWFCLLPVKLILSFHGSDIQIAKRSTGLKRLGWRILLWRANRLVACSNALAKEITEFCGRKVDVIHNGIDPFHASQEAASSDVTPISEPYILCVANYERQKGHDVLLKAFAKSETSKKLVLIGSPRAETQNIRELVSSLHLTDRVVMLENLSHPDVMKWVQRASLFVLPSRREAFSLVLLEAGVFGIPVVASNVGGIPEIINNGNGVLIPPDDVDSLAHALILSHNGNGEALKNVVCRKFSWHDATEKYFALGH